MTFRIILSFTCLAATLSAHAQQYTSDIEAVSIGIPLGLCAFILFYCWLWRVIKKSECEENGSSGNEIRLTDTHQSTYSQTVEKMHSLEAIDKLSLWENHRMNKGNYAKAVESLIGRGVQQISEKDLLEKISTFERMAKLFNCHISELKPVTIKKFESSFNRAELRFVVYRLTSRIEVESRKYNISSCNTASYYVRTWLSEHLNETFIIQR